MAKHFILVQALRWVLLSQSHQPSTITLGAASVPSPRVCEKQVSSVDMIKVERLQSVSILGDQTKRLCLQNYRRIWFGQSNECFTGYDASEIPF